MKKLFDEMRSNPELAQKYLEHLRNAQTDEFKAKARESIKRLITGIVEETKRFAESQGKSFEIDDEMMKKMEEIHHQYLIKNQEMVANKLKELLGL